MRPLNHMRRIKAYLAKFSKCCLGKKKRLKKSCFLVSLSVSYLFLHVEIHSVFLHYHMINIQNNGSDVEVCFCCWYSFPGEFASLSCAPLLPGVTRLNFLRRVFEVNGDRSHVTQQICIYLSFAIEFHLLCKFIVKRKRLPLQFWKVVHMTLSLSGSVSKWRKTNIICLPDKKQHVLPSN